MKKKTSGHMSLMTVAWNFFTLKIEPSKSGLAATIVTRCPSKRVLRDLVHLIVLRYSVNEPP